MPQETNQKTKKAPAKKSPAKKAPHSPSKDARRAFEHLGRVRVLLSLSKHDHKQFDTLLRVATQAFQAEQYKHAAELLRAGEHFAFAALLQEDREEVSSELREDIRRELTHLQEKADDHAEPEGMAKPVRNLFEAAVKGARECSEAEAYRSALEYARAAGALAHVVDLGKTSLLEHPFKRLAA